MDFLNLWKHCYRLTHASFHKYKYTWLTAISMSLLTALPAKMSAFNSLMQQNACHRKITWTFADLLPCYCYAIKNNSRTTARDFRKPPLQAKEGTWVNCKLITAWHY